MKKYIKYIGLVILSTVLFSCKKDNFVSTDTQVGISNVTYFANFNMSGAQYQSIVKGGTYTEAGVTATETGKPLKVTTDGTVNTAVVGLYIINYSATNKDGFASSVSRYIAVLPSAEVAGVDISGKYDYAAGGTTATITKLAPGFYYVSNIYSAATTIPAYLISVNGTAITVPLQETGFGRLQGTAALAGNTSGSTLNYTISLLDQGISGTVRKWLKH